MKSLGNRLEARQGENGRSLVLGLIHEMRMRSLAKRFAALQAGSGNRTGHGLVNENGRPDWVDSSPEEGHEFRNHVYDVLRYREQS